MTRGNLTRRAFAVAGEVPMEFGGDGVFAGILDDAMAVESDDLSARLIFGFANEKLRKPRQIKILGLFLPLTLAAPSCTFICTNERSGEIVASKRGLGDEPRRHGNT